jgi:septal ring factor EnvC (AmiA/AmiB activator)
MVERSSAIPAWAWIVGAVLVIGIVFTGYRTVQTQRHLETVQSELNSAKQAADLVRAQTADLEKRTATINSELEKASVERNELQSEIVRLKGELEQATRSQSP